MIKINLATFERGDNEEIRITLNGAERDALQVGAWKKNEKGEWQLSYKNITFRAEELLALSDAFNEAARLSECHSKMFMEVG